VENITILPWDNRIHSPAGLEEYEFDDMYVIQIFTTRFW